MSFNPEYLLNYLSPDLMLDRPARETLEREYRQRPYSGTDGFVSNILENRSNFIRTFDELMCNIEEEIYAFLRRNRYGLERYLREIIVSVIHKYNYSYSVSEETEEIKKIEMFILGFTKKIEKYFHSKYRFYLDQIEREHLSNSVRIIISGCEDCSNHLPYRKALIINPNMFF